MKLPNGDAAIVDDNKLAGYCLNTEHDPGKNKARVFLSALGLTAADAAELKVALLAAAANEDAQAKENDEFGQRYVVRFVMTRLVDEEAKSAVILSAWMVRANEDFPRLTTCYVD